MRRFIVTEEMPDLVMSATPASLRPLMSEIFTAGLLKRLKLRSGNNTASVRFSQVFKSLYLLVIPSFAYLSDISSAMILPYNLLAMELSEYLSRQLSHTKISSSPVDVIRLLLCAFGIWQ